MGTTAKVKRILKKLDELYPFDGVCFLHYRQPWQLMVSTILSAQCTDDRVNMVTEALFKEYPTPEALAEADLTSLENAVRPTGFFRMKASNIKQSMEKLITEYSGEMPSDIGLLTSFPGVGRKTANVIRSHVFQIPSIVVDTHVKRVTYRLGLSKNTDPARVELDLMEILPKSHWIRYNQQIITHGRLVCKSQNPKCGECVFKKECVV